MHNCDENKHEVADAEGLCMGRIRCDGGGQCGGRFAELACNLGSKIETRPPYTPQGNAIAERGFGTTIQKEQREA